MQREYDSIVIGGGVAGLSTALQLARRGQRVAVLERQRLGSGSTSKAAGLLGQLRGTAAQTRFQMDALGIIRELQQQTGLELFVPSGSLRIAETPERVAELRSVSALGREMDLEVEEPPIEEVARMVPYMRTDDLLFACHFPTDGYVMPAELATAYVQVGRTLGVVYEIGCHVEEIILEGRHATGVRTQQGDYRAPVVVNAAGPWCYLLPEALGGRVTTAAVAHYNLITRPNEERPIEPLCPVVRDRHHGIYARPETGGLLVGMYEADPVVYQMGALPADFDMQALKAGRDEENVAELIYLAGQRFPWINERTPMTIVKGLMSFTPDSQPLCGPMPDFEGLYHCCGMSGRGIVQSPTVGVIMAELIVEGTTRYDVASVTADRFFDDPGLRERSAIEAQCRQMYARIYGGLEQAEPTSIEPRETETR